MNVELIFSIALGVILGGIGLMYLPKILSSIVWFFVNIFPLLCGFGFLYFLYYSGTLSLRAIVAMCAIYGLFVVVSLIYGGYRYFRSDIDKNQDASNLMNFFTWSYTNNRLLTFRPNGLSNIGYFVGRNFRNKNFSTPGMF